MSEIATKVGESTTTCTAYIKNLINLGIIKRETPHADRIYIAWTLVGK